MSELWFDYGKRIIRRTNLFTGNSNSPRYCTPSAASSVAALPPDHSLLILPLAQPAILMSQCDIGWLTHWADPASDTV